MKAAAAWSILAERIDGDLRQPVALKLLQLTEAPDEALNRRFATERQILSRLSHPNIAHLIDGGLTAEGRPFLATEFVDGQQIDLWCEEKQATLHQRIELFLKVIAAVDYAHRHMVIHRDLKPAQYSGHCRRRAQAAGFRHRPACWMPEAEES